jgi:hypothetical protein
MQYDAVVPREKIRLAQGNRLQTVVRLCAVIGAVALCLSGSLHCNPQVVKVTFGLILKVDMMTLGGLVAMCTAPELVKMARPADGAKGRREQLTAFSRQPPSEVQRIIQKHVYQEDDKASAGEYWGGVLKAGRRSATAPQQLHNKHAAARQDTFDDKERRRAAQAWADEVSAVTPLSTQRELLRGGHRNAALHTAPHGSTDKVRGQQAHRDPQVILHLSASEQKAAESQEAAARAWAFKVSAVAEAGGDVDAVLSGKGKQPQPQRVQQAQHPQQKPKWQREDAKSRSARKSADRSRKEDAKAKAWAEVHDYLSEQLCAIASCSERDFLRALPPALTLARV